MSRRNREGRYHHAIGRARQRYGIGFDADDIDVILARCLAGHAALIQDKPKKGRTFVLRYKDVEIVPVISADEPPVLVTFLSYDSHEYQRHLADKRRAA